MSKVFRIFVEKKKGNDIEAGQTLADLRDNVGLSALEDLRIINRYYAQGLTEEEFNLAVKQILSEPNLDNVYTELSIPEDYRYFAMEYLPGQYDQRADSAAQCIQLLTAGERPEVQSAKIIAVKGDITDEEFEKIKNYIINPVESRVASLEIPESLNIKSDVPADIARIDGFIDMSDDEIEAYHSSMGFAMSIADLCWVRDYFKNDESRNPSLTELKVIDTYWSDHCRHTTFATQLDEIKIDSGKYTDAINKALEQYFDIRKEVYGDRDKIVCLMDMACIGTKVLKKRGLVNNLDESEEINACSIEVPVVIDGKTEQWLVQFKNETHNHPTEIEPFGGREYAVRAVPDNLFSVAKKELLMEMIDDLSEDAGARTADMIHDRVATMSCKAAVKGNNHLSFAEADHLIDELLNLDNPYACPHGRPTIISMSRHELEKKFKRIV